MELFLLDKFASGVMIGFYIIGAVVVLAAITAIVKTTKGVNNENKY